MQIKLYNPTEPQKDFHKLVHEDKPFISCIVAGRQTGKTFFMQNDILMRALNNPKHRMFWVSPIQDQANKVMKDIESMFSNHQEVWDKIIKRYDRKHNEIYLYNGSFIKFRSADSGDNLRGATLDFIYLDEAAYMKLDFINEVLLPMVTRTKGRVVMSSTFNGPNWYFDKYKDGQSKSNWEEIKSIKKTYLDLNDRDVERTVAGVRKSMTKAQFDQEYLCKPVSANALFSNIEEAVVPQLNTPYERIYIGMDIGVAQDYTVMTAMNEHNEIIDIHRFNYKEEGMDYEEFKERIKSFYLKHDDKLSACYFEVNNNDLLFDDLTDDERLYKMIPFITSAKTKPEIIRNLIKQFEDGNIKIPNNEELIKELYDFKSKRNPITGNLQFSNTDGKHDDMVMSLAITAYCAKEEQDGGVTMFL
jgi:phage FluMu gp28-like protein